MRWRTTARRSESGRGDVRDARRDEGVPLDGNRRRRKREGARCEQRRAQMLGGAATVLRVERRRAAMVMNARKQLVAEGVRMRPQRRRAARQRIGGDLAVDVESPCMGNVSEIERGKVRVERSMVHRLVERRLRGGLLVGEVDGARRAMNVVSAVSLVVQPVEDGRNQRACRIDGQGEAGYGSRSAQGDPWYYDLRGLVDRPRCTSRSTQFAPGPLIVRANPVTILLRSSHHQAHRRGRTVPSRTDPAHSAGRDESCRAFPNISELTPSRAFGLCTTRAACSIRTALSSAK